MSHRNGSAAMAALVLALLSGTANATLLTFFEDNTAANATGAPAQPFVVDNDVKSRISDFQAGLTSLSTYEFEGSTPFNATRCRRRDDRGRKSATLRFGSGLSNKLSRVDSIRPGWPALG